jgi:chromosome segregation ATPase
MFGWLNRRVRSVRDEFAFRKAEREAHRRHKAEGQRRFNTDVLTAEIQAIEERIGADSRERFGPLLTETDEASRLANDALTEAERRLTLMSRDISRELAGHFRKLAEVRQRLDAAYSDRDDAQCDLDEAQENIEEWHDAVKGKSVPQQAMFGRSRDELEGYKTSREEARDDIADGRAQIASLKSKKALINLAIDLARADRSIVATHRKEGITVARCLKDFVEASVTVRDLSLRRDRLAEDRKLFVEASRHQLGIASRQSEIDRIHASHAAFLAAFEEPAAKERRRIAFIAARVRPAESRGA